MPDPMSRGIPDERPDSEQSAPNTASPSAATSLPGTPATGAAPDVAQTASSLADQAKQKLTGAIDGQKGAAADAIKEIAGTVRRAGEEFEGKQDWIASAIQRGATELDTIAASLRDKSIGDLVDQVRSFARQQPAIFVGAALVGGFAVARLGKMVAGDLSRDDLPNMAEVGNGQH